MRTLAGVTEPPCAGEGNCYRGGISRCTPTRGSPKKFRQIVKQPYNLPVMELQVFEQRSFVAGMWIQHGRDEPLDRADFHNAPDVQVARVGARAYGGGAKGAEKAAYLKAIAHGVNDREMAL